MTVVARITCETRPGLLPAFRIASDKSWAWRPGDEASQRISSNNNGRHILFRVVVDHTGIHRVDSALHGAMLTPELPLLGHFCITPGNIVQFEDSANLWK